MSGTRFPSRHMWRLSPAWRMTFRNPTLLWRSQRSYLTSTNVLWTMARIKSNGLSICDYWVTNIMCSLIALLSMYHIQSGVSKKILGIGRRLRMNGLPKGPVRSGELRCTFSSMLFRRKLRGVPLGQKYRLPFVTVFSVWYWWLNCAPVCCKNLFVWWTKRPRPLVRFLHNLLHNRRMAFKPNYSKKSGFVRCFGLR